MQQVKNYQNHAICVCTIEKTVTIMLNVYVVAKQLEKEMLNVYLGCEKLEKSS